jgi:hypothetical protein
MKLRRGNHSKRRQQSRDECWATLPEPPNRILQPAAISQNSTSIVAAGATLRQIAMTTVSSASEQHQRFLGCIHRSCETWHECESITQQLGNGSCQKAEAIRTKFGKPGFGAKADPCSAGSSHRPRTTPYVHCIRQSGGLLHHANPDTYPAEKTERFGAGPVSCTQVTLACLE